MKDQKKLTRDIQGKKPIYLGVDWDIKTINLLNAIVLDLLSYKRVISNGCQLTVVSKDPAFLKRICDAMNISCVEAKGFGDVTKIWKLYFEKEVPMQPDGAEMVYTKQVSSPGRTILRMEKGNPRYPSLYNYRDNVALPPGKNPNINKIPPRMHNGLPNVLQPWF